MTLLLSLVVALADEPAPTELPPDPAPTAEPTPSPDTPGTPGTPDVPAPDAEPAPPADGGFQVPDAGGFTVPDAGGLTVPDGGAPLPADVTPMPDAADDAKVKYEIGGIVQYDLRFRPVQYTYGTYYQDIADPPTLSRNELMLKLKGSVKSAKFGAVANVDFVARAYPQARKLDDLTTYNLVSPFRFEMHDLYLYGRDLFGLRGLDVKVGQQKAMFGVGDQFNPTNNINANDLEDILLFGDQLGNLMVRADYAPLWNLTFTGILVPVFKPALLPPTAYLAQTPDRYPFVSDELRHNLAVEQAFAEQLGYPTIVNDVSIEHPEFSAKNMQGFVRVGASLGGQDIALSYYNGRSDVPQAVRNTTRMVDAPQCSDPNADPSDPDADCVVGTLSSDVVLTYPKMQVLGFNMAGEMNPFGKIHKSFKSIGYRLELAVIFPKETRLEVIQDDVSFLGQTRDGEYDYPGGDNRVIDSRPFAKWTLGLDYQFNRHLYMNTQWVHGFVDEFGAGDWIQPGTTTRASGIREGVENVVLECLDLSTLSGNGEACAEEWLKPRLGDYLVWGTDINFASQRGLLRIFTIWDLIGVYKDTFDPDSGARVRTRYGMFTPEGFSAVIYPMLSWKLGYGLELQGGALLQFGKPWTKFGAAETGGHQIWTRARFSF